MSRSLVTGSAGHLGEALMRTLDERGHEAVGLDLLASPYTTVRGSLSDQQVVVGAMPRGRARAAHTATLHKPHVGSHRRQDFIDTNVTGTLTVLGRGRGGCAAWCSPAAPARSAAR